MHVVSQMSWPDERLADSLNVWLSMLRTVSAYITAIAYSRAGSVDPIRDPPIIQCRMQCQIFTSRCNDCRSNRLKCSLPDHMAV